MNTVNHFFTPRAHKALWHKERGIVLLSCLVLLILILSLLRFMMSTSHISERRSGVDWEMFKAKEYSLEALTRAEIAIVCPGAAAGSECKSSDSGTRKAAFEKWAKWLVDDTVANPETGFVRNRQILATNPQCKHIWKCTNWRVSGGGNKTNSLGNHYTPYSDLIRSGKTSSDFQYIVEVFSGKEMGLPNEQDTTADDINNLIFRVTAIGYGEVEAGGGSQETRHMTQADYVFPREEE